MFTAPVWRDSDGQKRRRGGRLRMILCSSLTPQPAAYLSHAHTNTHTHSHTHSLTLTRARAHAYMRARARSLRTAVSLRCWKPASVTYGAAPTSVSRVQLHRTRGIRDTSRWECPDPHDPAHRHDNICVSLCISVGGATARPRTCLGSVTGHYHHIAPKGERETGVHIGVAAQFPLPRKI